MKIGQIIDEKMNKYSFHFLSLSFWYFILIFIAIAVIGLVGSQENIQFGQVVFWWTLFFFPTIIFPLLLTTIMITYKILLKKEQNNINFRIKSDFLTKNFLYKIFIILSLILTFVLVPILLIGYTELLIAGDSVQLYIVGIILTSFVIMLYLIINR